MGTALAMLFSITRADATVCPNAISITSVPVSNQAIVCGTTNDITSSNVTSTCGSTFYYGGLEALYTYTATTSGQVQISVDGGTTTNYIGLFVFDGCPTTTGTNCMGASNTSFGYTGSLIVTLTAGTTYYLMFDTWPSPASPCPATFSISTCVTPTAPATTLVNTTDATFGWTGTAASYQVEYGTSATLGDPGNSRVIASANSYMAMGLTSATTYNWWVRSVCGPGDTSAWTAVTTFTTACLPVTSLPWSENFDGMATTGYQVLPNCWTLQNNSSWYTGAFGPGAPHSGANYLFTYGFVADALLWTPGFSLTAGTSYDFSFWWKGDGANTWDGSASYNTSTDTTGATILGKFATSGTATPSGYQLITYTFTPATTGAYYFDLFLNSPNGGNGFSFDDFIVSATPSCSAPTQVAVTNISSTGATVNWTASISTPANGYRYEVRSSGAAGSGNTGLVSTGTVAAGSTTVNLTGLTPNTTDTVYIMSLCSATDSSTWTYAIGFTTLCSPVNTYPFVESFPSTGLPSCWSASNAGGGFYNWTGTASDVTHGVSAPFAGSGFAFLNVYNAQTSSNPYVLNAPSFDLTGAPKQLEYYYFLGSGGYQGTSGATGSDPYPLQVLVSANNGTTWDTLYQHSSANSTIATSNSPSFWTQNIIDLSAYAGQTVIFQFLSQSNYGNNITNQGIDEFTVMDIPSCAAPTGLTTSNITANSVDLSWNASITPPALGYLYEIRTSGAPGSGATGLVVSNTTQPGFTTATESGLTASTFYSVYVRALCSLTDSSAWSFADTFTTTISCFQPTSVTATNVTTTSVDLNWTSPTAPPGSGYQYEIRTSGAPGSGATGLFVANSTAAGTTTATETGLSASTTYSVYVRSICGSGDTSLWTGATNFYTPCIPPTVTGTTGASRCSAGSVTLTATGTGNSFYWYNNNTTDTVAGTGASFTTPSISATSTYYVATANTTVYTGLGNTQIPGGSSNFSANRGIVVQTTQSFSLDSAQVYSDGTTGFVSGTATLVDDATGTIITTTTFSIPANGPQWYTMNLGWNLTGGNTYRLMATFSGNSVRRIDGFAGGVADYTTPAFNNLGPLGTIIGGYDFGPSTTTYNYFHNISATSLCASPRVAVVATVGTGSPVNLGNDTTICAGSSLTLDAGNPGASYSWNTGANSQTISVNAAGTYSVTVTNAAGCSDTDTIMVMTTPAPTVMLGNDTAICPGSTVTLNAGNMGTGATYMWSTGANTQSLVVANAGTYSVAVMSSTGCTGRDTIIVMNAPVPVVNLGRDTMLCIGSSLALNAGNAGGSYAWSTGATTSSITVNTPGIYSVSVTNTSGCVGGDTINVMPGMMPNAGTINFTNASPTFSFSSMGGSPGMHGWSFGDGTFDTAATPTHTYTANGTYTVSYVVRNPCGSDTATTTVTVTNIGVNTVTLNGEVTLAPNPASDRVLIRNNNAQAMKHITVLNAVGAVVRELNAQNGKEQSIDLSGLAAATYMVRIEFDGGAIVVRRLQITQ